jgi:hypothetical protein
MSANISSGEHFQGISAYNVEDRKILKTLTDIHRLQGHFIAIYITPARAQVHVEHNFEQERIKYIVKELSREELASKILRKDNARKKQVAMLHVGELFTAVGIDMFQRILINKNKGAEFMKDMISLVAEYTLLRDYCNEQYKEISMTYKVCVPYITKDWDVDTSKFNSKGATDKYIEKRDTKRKELIEEHDKWYRDRDLLQMEEQQKRLQEEMVMKEQEQEQEQ